jgi:hypothetical protein
MEMKSAEQTTADAKPYTEKRNIFLISNNRTLIR